MNGRHQCLAARSLQDVPFSSADMLVTRSLSEVIVHVEL